MTLEELLANPAARGWQQNYTYNPSSENWEQMWIHGPTGQRTSGDLNEFLRNAYNDTQQFDAGTRQAMGLPGSQDLEDMRMQRLWDSAQGSPAQRFSQMLQAGGGDTAGMGDWLLRTGRITPQELYGTGEWTAYSQDLATGTPWAQRLFQNVAEIAPVAAMGYGATQALGAGAGGAAAAAEGTAAGGAAGGAVVPVSGGAAGAAGAAGGAAAAGAASAGGSAGGGAVGGAAGGGAAAAGGAAGAGSALSRILDGTASDADWLSVIGTGAATGLGIAGSNQQADALRDIAAQSRSDRAPFLSRSLEYLNNPNAYLEGPGKAAGDAVLRGLSVRGNPAGMPSSMSIASEAALRDWRDATTGFANLGLAGEDVRASALTRAAGADANAFNAVGAGLADVTQPRRRTLAEMMNSLT